MHALDVLGDPVRRRILELLADHGGHGMRAHGSPELSAGEIGEVVQQEFGISQPAVSQHLRVLREHGFATVRAEGRRRLYAVDARGPREAKDWLSPFEQFWLPKLDALGTELARGKRQRRLRADAAASAPPPAVSTAPSAASAGPATVAAATNVASATNAAAATNSAPSTTSASATNSAPGTRPVTAPTPKET